MKNILFAAFTLFIFSQCTEEEVTPTNVQPAAEQAVVLPEHPTGSMTISGAFTNYEDTEDCKTCTFVVPGDATIVDGEELKLKAGSVICLDKALRYGDIEFVNLVGTESQPIRIGGTTFTK